MENQNPYRPKIASIPEGVTRPLWSVMIPTYNCANYLRETLTSVLAQDPGSDLMQIEVIDDHSMQDNPAAVVEELGRGRVEFYQQPQNVGYIRNFETCLLRSRGQLIHLLHGDDCVLDGFYRKMQQLFEEYPEIGAAFCRHIIMDEHGHWKWFSSLEQPQSGVLENWLERIASELPLQTPSMVVRREVYEKLGSFDSRMLSCGEDWEMWCRIAADYQTGYEPQPLALYRDRSNSLTKGSVRTGQNIRDVRQATEIIQLYLPETVAPKITQKARISWALWAISFAERMIAQDDLTAALIQIREALICSRSLEVVKLATFLMLRISKRWLMQVLRSISSRAEKKGVRCQDANSV